MGPLHPVRTWMCALRRDNRALIKPRDTWPTVALTPTCCVADGDDGSPPDIGGGDVLVFTLELLKINGNRTPAMPRHTRCAVIAS